MDKIKEVMGLVKEYGDQRSFDCHYDEDLCGDVEAINLKKAIESKLRELLEREPIAHLWQHSDTGRTRVIMAGDVWTSSREWSYVGPLVLGIGNESKEM